MNTTAPPAPAGAAWTGTAWARAGLAVLGGLLLALRKPWALHTPQLWAEDGSIFLTQDDQWGARAILEPYNGYLHLLPRLIAWTARHVADVAWWPAIYNGLAFALSVALFARLLSPRLALPGKPWLMLALPLVAGTGEVLINVTNLQWVTAFFLILHLFLRRGETLAVRASDLLILAVVGLNGPFAIVLLPLFAWRAWRERNVDTGLALAVLAGCAVTQAWLLLRQGTPLDIQASQERFRPLMFASIIGSRLVTWPFAGPAAVRAWPVWIHAALGAAVILPVLAWSLRRDALRAPRALVAAAFVLVTVACAYRARVDSWNDDNLVNGDRYFYISRVLLTWLLILQFGAAPRWAARAAVALCGLAVVVHVPRFILPAPPDYRWAEHCDPIRRGVPANIMGFMRFAWAS